MKRNAYALAAVLACAAGPLAAQTTAPVFTAYYSIGDSLAAGFESGSLVETHQVVSAPALIARQAGVVDFQLPKVSEPGIPVELGHCVAQGGIDEVATVAQCVQCCGHATSFAARMRELSPTAEAAAAPLRTAPDRKSVV